MAQYEFYLTPLMRAVANTDTAAVEELLSQGASIHACDTRGWNAFHEAATDDTRIDCLKIILSYSTSCINSKTFQGETPLFLACQNQCLKIIKLLLNYRICNVNLSNNDGVSPLHLACSNIHISLVNLLVKRGAKVNAQDCNGSTPLHETFSSRDIRKRKDEVSSIVFYLLHHEANPNLTDYNENYPFHLACQSGILTSFHLLFTVSKHLINTSNIFGSTPLMLAVSSKNIAITEYLLSRNADPNVADYSNMTPLHLAVRTGSSIIFNIIYEVTSKELITKYCTFDEKRDLEEVLQFKNINSLTCLAIDTHKLQFLTELLESGIDPNALHCPVIYDENEVEQALILHSPISYLLENKMCDLGERTVGFLTTLISHGSPLKMTSKSGLISYIDPVFAVAKHCGHHIGISCLRILLDYGVDPDFPHGRMPFAMQKACKHTCTEAVLLLLQFSNVLEPEDILNWIEQEQFTNQEKIVEALLPLAPYYIPSNSLLPDLFDVSKRMHLLAPKVYSLANYSRSIVRKELHNEFRSTPTLFKKKIIDLGLPKTLYDYLCYK